MGLVQRNMAFKRCTYVSVPIHRIFPLWTLSVRRVSAGGETQYCLDRANCWISVCARSFLVLLSDPRRVLPSALWQTRRVLYGPKARDLKVAGLQKISSFEMESP
jgi:hypothetical protein